MRWVGICTFAAVAMAAVGIVRAQNPPSAQPEVFAQNNALGPFVPVASATPTGPAPVAGEPAPAISAADALELAAWARQQAASNGDVLRVNGITLEDAEELEAWAREQAGRDTSWSTQAASPGVQQVSSPAVQPGSAVAPQNAVSPNVRTFQGPPGYYPPGFNSGANARVSSNDVPAAVTHPVRAQEGQSNSPGTATTSEPEELHVPADGNVKPGCDTCDGQCLWGCCWRQWCEAGLVGGVELGFLGPLGEPSQSVTQTNLVTGQAFTGTTESALATSVRIWLGVQHAGGFGYRARYGHIGVDYIDLDPTVPVIVDGETAFREEYYLCGDTFDLELTHRYCLFNWVFDASFGGRYARLERNAMSLGYGQLSEVELTGLAVGANELEGAGFTFSVGANAPVGLWWSKHHAGDDACKPHPPFDNIHSRIACCAPNLLCGWRWFWGLRGSLLWADTAASAFTEANAAVRTTASTGSSYSRDQAYASEDQSDNVFIGEAVLGLQWEHCCQCLPAVFFLRAGLEYQHWETGNVCARSNSFAFLHDGPDTVGGRVDAVANAHDGDLDLFGFVIGGGITY